MNTQLFTGSMRHQHTSKKRGASDTGERAQLDFHSEGSRRLGTILRIQASAATESVQKMTGVCGGWWERGVV